MKKRVTVVSPASSANLGAGYDVFALALRKPFDTLTLQRTESGVTLQVERGRVDTDSRKNVVSGVVRAVKRGEEIGEGVSLRLRKGVPIGAGLGSSAASSAAAAVGMNALFDLGLDTRKLIEYAGVGEKMSSGAAHYDNVGAAIVGGFVIVSGSEGFVGMKAPSNLALCLATPDLPLPPRKTEFARSLVPNHLSLDEVVGAVISASMMVRGFSTGNLEEIGRAMQGGFVDPRRAVMIPGFEKVRESALEAGAFGACISGAGPTVLAATTRRKARGVLKAMLRGFRSAAVQSQGFVTSVGEGCRVIEQI
jgi:homoserine kinase